RDPSARRVHPGIHAVSLEQLVTDEVHEEQVWLLPVFLGEGFQVRGQLHPYLSQFLRDDDSKDGCVMGTRNRGMSLSKHMVPHLLEVPRRPALGVRDDHRLVDEDRDAERMEVSRADVEVAVDLLLDDCGRVVIATEELTGICDPSVRFPASDDMSFLLQVLT